VKQVTQRTRFSLMGRLLKMLTPILRIGLKGMSIGPAGSHHPCANQPQRGLR
jgi:hypothetical protein